jgi:DNA modification methylase
MIIRCSHAGVLSIADLKAKFHPKNRNKHPESQIARLAEILKYQGVRYPAKISNRSGNITSGHGRILAAEHNGWDVFPVDYQDYDSEEQEYADVQADNAIALWAELDFSGINADLPDLGPDFDIDMLGIKNFVLEPAEKASLGDPEAIQENVETRVKHGDVWILGGNRLMCGDSTVITDVEKLMAGEKAVMWSSDPPYGINHVEVANEKGQAKGYDNIKNDELQDEALKEFIYNSITTSLPFLEKGFAFYMWHAMKMQAYFSQAAAAAAAGILFHRQIIWVKPQFVFGRGQYHWRHELCLMGWLQGDEPPFYGPKNQSTIWEVGRENDKIHPTQKPVELFAIPIRNHMKPGQIVYEPFAGSGSGIIAAEMENVRCFAMELEPVYCDRILARWEAFTGLTAERVDG